MSFSEVMILILSCSSVWLVARQEEWKRWGYIVGLAAQPFWFYTTITHHQWALLTLTIVYTYSWSMGIYNYWIKKPEQKNTCGCGQVWCPECGG